MAWANFRVADNTPGTPARPILAEAVNVGCCGLVEPPPVKRLV